MPPYKIAVIGATGNLGAPVTQDLINAGFAVTIIARSPEKVRALFPSTPIIQGDVTDVASLIAAFQGQDALYLNLSVLQTEKPSDFHTETDGMTNILAAAKQAGIQRIAYLSSIVMRYQGMNNFRWWVFEIKHKAVQLIKDSGIPYLIFYPSTFMESFHFQIRGNKLGLVGKSTAKMWFIAASDYGKQVAKAFEIVPLNESKQYVIQGPEGYTADEAAALFIKNYTKQQLTVMKAPTFALKLAGLFNQQMNYVWHICEALNRYPEKFAAQKTWDELGTPTTTIADYARKA
ncbi:MAG: NAD(P)H-binding protein [Spirosomataceae bacterium]